MVTQGYKDLDVWKRSMDLVTHVYALTQNFPKEELYTLTSQIRRAAVSIPSNIAEGRSKRSTKDFMRYINISYGSIAELETQIIIGERLGYASDAEVSPLLHELGNLGRMLNGLLSSLDKKLATP